jgi:hypothetical protein
MRSNAGAPSQLFPTSPIVLIVIVLDQHADHCRQRRRRIGSDQLERGTSLSYSLHLRMPGMKGLELLQKLKDHSDHEQVSRVASRGPAPSV